MSVQFEWQVGSDDGQWETIARMGRRPRRRWPWWKWTVMAAVIVAVVALGYAVARRRYEEVRRQIRFQIQAVIDLEARTFAEGDVDLFMKQQDENSSDWYTQQAVRVRTGCVGPQARCEPILSAQIQALELRGKIAWVEVTEGQPSVRRARFYRETDLGWKHTAPRSTFWGPEKEVQYGNVLVRYHKRDQARIGPLLRRVSEAAEDVCAAVACPATSRLEVRLTTEIPLDKGPRLNQEPIQQDSDKLILPSPWLSGIPADGAWDESDLDEITYWVTYGMAGKAMRSALNRALNPLQEAILDEYAAWYSQGDISQAPLLGRIIAQHSADALPNIFQTVKENASVDALLSQWLSLSAVEQQTAYFETLLSIERDALLVGRRDTFLLLQDPVQQEWVEQREELFDAVQLDRSFFSLPLIRVMEVELDSQRVHVLLGEPLVRFEGQDPSDREPVAFFQLRGQDWKHTSPF